MSALKLIPVGNSVGVILPKDILARLGMEKGDSLFAIEAPDGLHLSVRDPDQQAQMETARQVMHERRAVLRELAGR